MSWIYDTPFFFHRISRMNQRQSCLSDYSRNFAEFWPLANGSRPIYAAVVFGHADFADGADFSSWDYFCPTDFTDLHRFFSSEGFSSDFTDESEGILAYRITHGISQNFGRWPMAHALYMLLLFLVTQISQMAQIFLRGIIFVPQISQIYTDFFHRKVFHRISRMNQKAFLLIGLLTEFRRILAAGQWLTPYICCCCFWSRRFRR